MVKNLSRQNWNGVSQEFTFHNERVQHIRTSVPSISVGEADGSVPPISVGEAHGSQR